MPTCRTCCAPPKRSRAISNAQPPRVSQVAGVAGGGLVLAFYIGERATALANTNGSDKSFAPNAFLRIAPDGSITHLFQESGNRPGHQDLVPDDHRRRARRRLVATCASSRRRSIQRCTAGRAPAARARFRRTGISCAVPARRRARCWSPPPRNDWNVSEAECTTENSSVVHKASNRQLELRRAREQGGRAARAGREVAQAEGAQGLQAARQAHHRRRQPR